MILDYMYDDGIDSILDFELDDEDMEFLREEEI